MKSQMSYMDRCHCCRKGSKWKKSTEKWPIPYKFGVHFQLLLAALDRREESQQDFLGLLSSFHLILRPLLGQNPEKLLCIQLHSTKSITRGALAR